MLYLEYIAVAVLLLVQTTVSHTVLTIPTSRTARADVITGTCGGSTALPLTSNIPLVGGSQLMVKWDEFVDHAGFFRISIANRGSMQAPAQAQFDENVLWQGQDPLGTSGLQSTVVTVPNIACTNCTLQLVQANGMWNNTLYYSCSDVRITVDPALDLSNPKLATPCAVSDHTGPLGGQSSYCMEGVWVPNLQVRCDQAGQTYLCPITPVATALVPSLLCPAGICSPTSCCRPSCTAAVCTSGFTAKVFLPVTTCVASLCTIAECCDSNPTCADTAQVVCAPTGFTPKVGAALTTTKCASSPCTTTECCTFNATCTATVCALAGSVHAKTTLPLTCAAASCTVSECCDPNPACTSAVCTSGFTPLPNMPADPCQNASCTPEECCSLNPTCNATTDCLSTATITYEPVRPLPITPCLLAQCSTDECCIVVNSTPAPSPTPPTPIAPTPSTPTPSTPPTPPTPMPSPKPAPTPVNGTRLLEGVYTAEDLNATNPKDLFYLILILVGGLCVVLACVFLLCRCLKKKTGKGLSSYGQDAEMGLAKTKPEKKKKGDSFSSSSSSSSDDDDKKNNSYTPSSTHFEKKKKKTTQQKLSAMPHAMPAIVYGEAEEGEEEEAEDLPHTASIDSLHEPSHVLDKDLVGSPLVKYLETEGNGSEASSFMRHNSLSCSGSQRRSIAPPKLVKPSINKGRQNSNSKNSQGLFQPKRSLFSNGRASLVAEGNEESEEEEKDTERGKSGDEERRESAESEEDDNHTEASSRDSMDDEITYIEDEDKEPPAPPAGHQLSFAQRTAAAGGGGGGGAGGGAGGGGGGGDGSQKADSVGSSSGDARITFEKDRWVVEKVDYKDYFYDSDEEDENKATKPIVIVVTDMKQNVYVGNCQTCVVQIKGKFTNLTMNSCKEVGVVFDKAIGSVELIRSEKCQVQVIENAPLVQIDKCDSCTLYLPEDSNGTKIYTSQCQTVEVMKPKGDDMVDFSLPNQLVHSFHADSSCENLSCKSEIKTG